MLTIKNILSGDSRPYSRSKHRTRPTNPLLMAAYLLADRHFSKPGSYDTKDLVATLLGHGARAWRMSQPRSRIRIKSYNPNGHYGVRIKV